MNKRSIIVTLAVIFGAWFAINVASAAPKHTISLHSDSLGDSNINSYQFGAGLGVGSPRGGDRTVSEPSLSEVTISRYTDETSPLFFHALTTGSPIGDMVITDGALSMELRDVIISGYSLSASDSATPKQGLQNESISLNFTRVIFSVANGTACFDRGDNNPDC